MTETTNTNPDYIKWCNSLSNMSDIEVSYAIYERIMNHSDIDKESLKIFDLAYDYCIKLIKQGKSLEPNLLKIYLTQVKGQDISQLNVMNLFALLGMCGINFQQQ